MQAGFSWVNVCPQSGRIPEGGDTPGRGQGKAGEDKPVSLQFSKMECYTPFHEKSIRKDVGHSSLRSSFLRLRSEGTSSSLGFKNIHDKSSRWARGDSQAP